MPDECWFLLNLGMADVHSKKVRSYNMSRIKGKNTKPEVLVRKWLHAAGYRFRLHDKKLPGKPDIGLKKYKTVIFVHGCFWHGHFGCRYFKMPSTRTDFWKKKIYENVARDSEHQEQIKALGWTVLVVWECELKTKQREQGLQSVLQQMKTQRSKLT